MSTILPVTLAWKQHVVRKLFCCCATNKARAVNHGKPDTVRLVDSFLLGTNIGSDSFPARYDL